MPERDALERASSLGEVIRLLREERGLSLRALAARIGVSAPFLSDVERNRRSTDKLDLLARELGVELDDLRKLDRRLSSELRQWMTDHPELSAFLEDFRRSGQPVATLLQSLRAAREK